MRRFWVIAIASMLALPLAWSGCGAEPSSSAPDVDEEATDEMDEEEPEEDDAGESAGGAMDEAAGGIEEAAGGVLDAAGDAMDESAGMAGEAAKEEPSTPQKEALVLYQAAWDKYQAAKVSWKKFRDETEAKEDWDTAKKLVEEALDSCDKIVEKDPTFEKVHDLARSCTTFRTTLLENKPE